MIGYEVMEMITKIENGSRVRMADAIRGLCLLGILAANMLIFQYGMYGKEEMELFGGLSGIDRAAHAFLKIAVEGSFYPIFLFLFGYSLFKLRDSLAKRGHKPWRSLVRRFLMLMGLGLLHSWLLWEGDILLLYGAMGFILLMFVGRKTKTLVIWGAILSVLMVAISYGAPSDSNSELFDEQHLESYVEKSIAVYGGGAYGEIMDFRMNEDPMNLDPIVAAVMVVLAPLIVTPMFLFGIAASKAGWLHNPKQERRRSGLLALALPAGLAFKSVGVLLPDWDWSGIFLMAGSQLLAFGYIFGAAFVMSYATGHSKIVESFEAVGRMSLTNYLMQTVICTTIFYGYGLGWFGKLGVVYGIVLTLFIFFLQAAASTVILRRAKHGPIEKLLRIWTYWSLSGKAKPAKKPAAPQANYSGPSVQ